MAIDWGLVNRIADSEDKVFRWMQSYLGHNRETGSDALREAASIDWVDAWQNWWDEGND